MSIKVALLVLLCTVSGFAATHAIRSGCANNGDGTTWACAGSPGGVGAYNAPPASTSWVRGDTYYVSGGAYSGQWKGSTVESSTTLITILGATAADHGTATGWSNSLGVDVAPAVFTSGSNNVFAAEIFFTTGYWVFNGNYNGGPAFGPSTGPFGFKMDNSWPHCITNPIYIDHLVTTVSILNTEVQGCGRYENTGEIRAVGSTGAVCNGAGTQVTLTTTTAQRWSASQYVNTSSIALPGYTNGVHQVASGIPGASSLVITASCTASQTSTVGGSVTGVLSTSAGNEVFVYANGGGSILLSHDYFHDTSAAFIQTQSVNGFTLEDSLLDGNSSNPTLHGDGWAEDGSSNLIARRNRVTDVEGTAPFAFCLNNGTTTNVNIYSNVLSQTIGNPYAVTSWGNGVVTCTSGGGSIAGLKYYGNTVANLTTGSPATIFASGTSTITNVDKRNNLFYNNTGGANDTVTSSVAGSPDYNTYLNTTTNDAGAHTTVNGAASNPFVSDTTDDYSLAYNTSTWTALPSPYDVDIVGTTRTSSRGAYQYVGGVTPPTCTLTASPAVIKSGTSSTLTFTPANTPTTCTIDNGVGAVSCSGATPSVSPTALTTYTATVSNAGGSNTCTATVTIGGVNINTGVKLNADTVIQ